MNDTYYKVSKILTKWKQYNSNLFEVWEDYLLLDFYLPHIHNGVKEESIPHLTFESLFSEKKVPFTRKFVYGVIDRVKRKQISERAFLESIALTENYLQKLSHMLYLYFPHKLRTKGEVADQQQNIMKIIIDSENREEIIERLSEEKIRRIFYSKSSDYFARDKADIGFGGYINSTYHSAILLYEEIIARRNIFIHNQGRIDRKYLREVEDSPYSLGDKLDVTKEYLKVCIVVLLGLSGVVTELALAKNYQITSYPQKLGKYVSIFDGLYKGK
jgi:hypothetical protein